MWQETEQQSLSELLEKLNEITPEVQDVMASDTEDDGFDGDQALFMVVGPARELAETIWGYIGKMYSDGKVETLAELAPFDVLNVLDQYAGDEIEDDKKGMVMLGCTASSLEEDIIDIIINDTDNITYRVMLTARCYGMQALNIGILSALQDASDNGIHVKKVWDATMDGKTRPTHYDLHGTALELDEYFETPNGYALYPGGFDVPEEDCNCRCILRFEVVEGE